MVLLRISSPGEIVTGLHGLIIARFDNFGKVVKSHPDRFDNFGKVVKSHPECITT
jgi:hypothetical protein